MRHRKKTLKLSRTFAHRQALFSNLVGSLIREEKIITTLPKAKAMAPLADRMITLAKKNSLAARRQALRLLKDRSLVKKLFNVIGPRFGDRRGGYTRVLKMPSFRRGDGSVTALVMFTEEGEVPRARAASKKSAGKVSTRNIKK